LHISATTLFSVPMSLLRMFFSIRLAASSSPTVVMVGRADFSNADLSAESSWAWYCSISWWPS